MTTHPPITLQEILQAVEISNDFANETQPDFSHHQFARLDADGNMINWRALMLNGSRVDHADLQHLDLSSLSLEDGEMRGSILDQSTIYQGNFARAALQGSRFRNCTLVRSSFHEARMEYTSFEGANLSHSTMTMVRAYHMQAQKCSAICVNFEGAMLQWSDFTHATLDGAHFKNADLTGVDFSYARLDGTTLDGAILLGTLFHSAEQVLATNIKAIKDSFMMYIIELDLNQLRVYRERIAHRSGSADLTEAFGVEPPYLVQRFCTNLFPTDEKDQPIRSIIVSWLDTWITASDKVEKEKNNG